MNFYFFRLIKFVGLVVARLNLVQNIQSEHSGLKTKSSNRLTAFLQPKVIVFKLLSPSVTSFTPCRLHFIYVPVVIWIWTLRGCWGRLVIRLESSCTNVYVVSVTVPKSKHLLKKSFNFVSQYTGEVY